jgi:hypothetical protein
MIKWIKVKRSKQNLLTIIRFLSKPLCGLHLNGTTSCTRRIAIFFVYEKTLFTRKTPQKTRQVERNRAYLLC